jgi:hypothetical protein
MLPITVTSDKMVTAIMRDDPDHKGESGKAEEFSESCRKVGK